MLRVPLADLDARRQDHSEKQSEQLGAPAPDNTSNVTGEFWISSTGKTHKQGCRYYGQGNSRHAKKASENDCKICGGARE